MFVPYGELRALATRTNKVVFCQIVATVAALSLQMVADCMGKKSIRQGRRRRDCGEGRTHSTAMKGDGGENNAKTASMTAHTDTHRRRRYQADPQREGQRGRRSTGAGRPTLIN